MAYFNIEKFIESEEPIEKRSNSRELCFICPFCEDDDVGRFYVNRETFKYFCHVCNRGGGPAEERTEQYTLMPPTKLCPVRMPSSYIELMPGPRELFYSLIRQQPTLRKFFKDRNFRWEDLQGWELGYCKSGLYADRLIIPIRTLNMLVAFQARTLINEKPKYRNLSSQGVYSQIFYNWDRAKAYDNIILVEGPFDAIRVGFNAIATMGTFLSAHRVSRINSLHPKRITLMFDPDRAGRHGSYIAARKIFPTIEVRIAILPEKKDPAELTRETLLNIVADAGKASLTQLFTD